MEEKQQIKPFLRVMNTDLIGEKPIIQALLKIKGVGFSMSSAICNTLGIIKNKKAGLLSDADAKKIEDLIKNAKDIPVWMFNRRFDETTGEMVHLTGSDLNFAVENDIKKFKKIKSYRGIRHAQGQPTRGQRTRSHFRHGRAVGVQKSKAGKPAAPAKEAKK
ncbi:30S ribosomal protein S13 [Candidatus Woesearchaeota archaeon]|nr:30S ribosomal protein S13 [Candidatus Woesearchaeota archaeon]